MVLPVPSAFGKSSVCSLSLIWMMSPCSWQGFSAETKRETRYTFHQYITQYREFSCCKNNQRKTQQPSNPKLKKPLFPPSILLRLSFKNNKTRPQKIKLKAKVIARMIKEGPKPASVISLCLNSQKRCLHLNGVGKTELPELLYLGDSL